LFLVQQGQLALASTPLRVRRYRDLLHGHPLKPETLHPDNRTSASFWWKFYSESTVLCKDFFSYYRK
ncbi:hypothetical protein ACLBVW_36395, partial [Pseudomonas aeruginosa]|uniref:hypothetical protein n=1 Tax=Pseudomonas aeruginosa TaxID=287 RepID=UPI00396A8F5C